MDKYEVVSVIGEGSFGRVYKARVFNSSEYVALKLIVKKGRTEKEIKGLSQECEILRKLSHPNIIPMLDSFETDNEIVVITEFVDRELYRILGSEGYFKEDRVQKITCDLVSALFYLHSHRVLHRDLKPQNVLLDQSGVAKLCDFGFARCMGTSTHVLTSIKGTPLYMAPELIDGRPYDHSADLWSLGCIVYELLVGTPPFSTYSILQLVHLLQNEPIKWPGFISEDCKTFLQGLLQKQPENRLNWKQILNHPFVKNGVVTSDSGNNYPFTSEMTASQSKAKETQTAEIIAKNDQWRNRETKPRTEGTEFKMPTTKTTSCPSQSNLTQSTMDVKNEKKTLHSSLISVVKNEKKLVSSVVSEMANLKVSGEIEEEERESPKVVDKSNSKEPINKPTAFKRSGQLFTLHSWDSAASARPIENEEWLAFLQKNMEEIIGGQLDCLRNHNLVSVVVAPLRNCNASCRVLERVSCMLSLPFVVNGPTDKDLEQIRQVYLEIKVIPNLIYASKIVARRRGYDSEASTPSVLPEGSQLTLRPVSELKADELQALQTIYLLVCNLVHSGEDFLVQFCDAVVLLNAVSLLQQFLLLGRRKVRIVTDILAILNLTFRELPENADVVEQIVLGSSSAGKSAVDLSRLLSHPSGVVRSRSCELVRHLCGHCPGAVHTYWSPRLEQDLHSLLSDSVPSVRKAAEEAYKDLKVLVEEKTG